MKTIWSILSRWIKTVGACATFLSLTYVGVPVHAQDVSCDLGGFSTVDLNVDFGTHTTAANNDATSPSSLTLTCSNSGSSSRAIKVCMGLGNGSGGISAGLRRMGSNLNLISYQLYRDAARTQVFSTLPNGAEFTTTLAANTVAPINTQIYLYGRIPAGQTQSIPEVGSYSSTFSSGDVTIQYRDYPIDGAAPDCASMFGEVLVNDSFTVKVNVLPMCNIIAITALNFGSRTSLQTPVNGNAAMLLSCNRGLPYTIAMDNGNNALGGNQRHMRLGSTSNLVAYEIYQNFNRTQRWGNTPSEIKNDTGTGNRQSQRIYGRIPGGQTITAPGNYQDTVVVTITY